MSDTLRAIKAIPIVNLQPGAPGEAPETKWIKIYKLRVNDEYQRKLSDKSIRLIRQIVRTFDWRKFHAPVVVQITPDTGSGDDTYEVLDGQHTATAAATHPLITEIPCVVLKDCAVEVKADAFVGLNQNKLRMSPLQIFAAELTSGDSIAHEVAEGARLAGATIIRRPPPYAEYAIGEVSAVSTLKAIARRGGTAYVKRVLEPGVLAGLAPITQEYIIAFDLLLLRSTNLKLSGIHGELPILISQAIRRIGPIELLEGAESNRRRSGDTLSYNIAFLIKRNIDEFTKKHRNP